MRGPATRAHFATSLAVDFLSVTDLEATLGADRRHFAQVAVKELVDNALDAAEAADILPAVTIDAVGDGEGTLTVTVADNGPGLPADVVERVLNFDHRVSDKRRYQTPSRGQQGNALKGIVGIAAVLGGQPVGIEACGVRHHLTARLLADHVLPTHHQTPTRTGTRVTLTVDAAAQQLDLHALAASYALANPHVTITVSGGAALGLPAAATASPSVTTRPLRSAASTSRGRTGSARPQGLGKVVMQRAIWVVFTPLR